MKFLYPLLQHTITQDFNGRPEVYAQFGLKSHGGIDWHADSGTPIYAMADGTVKELGDQGSAGYGKFVRLQHIGYESIYAHLSEQKVAKGDKIKAGQLIAISDNTGFSTAAHLHTGVRETDAEGNVLNYNNGWKGYIDFSGMLVDNLTPVISDYAKEAVEKAKLKGITEWSSPQEIVGDAVLEAMLVKVGIFSSTQGNVTKERMAIALDRMGAFDKAVNIIS